MLRKMCNLFSLFTHFHFVKSFTFLTCDHCRAYLLQWIATIVNVVRAGQRLESTEPLTVCELYDLHIHLHTLSLSLWSYGVFSKL